LELSIKSGYDQVDVKFDMALKFQTMDQTEHIQNCGTAETLEEEVVVYEEKDSMWSESPAELIERM